MPVFYPHHVVTVSACNRAAAHSAIFASPKNLIHPSFPPGPCVCSYYLASSQKAVPGGLEAVLCQASIVNVTNIRAQVSTGATFGMDPVISQQFLKFHGTKSPMSPGPHLTSSDSSLH